MSKLNPVQQIREKSDLVNAAHVAPHLVVAHGEDVDAVGNILKIKEKSLRKFALGAVGAQADFHVPAEIIVETKAEGLIFKKHFFTRRHEDVGNRLGLVAEISDAQSLPTDGDVFQGEFSVGVGHRANSWLKIQDLNSGANQRRFGLFVHHHTAQGGGLGKKSD